MIVFQSPAIAECLNHRAIIPPLPAGEGMGEGELANHARQSTLIWTSMLALRIRVSSRKKLRAIPVYFDLIRPIKDPPPPTLMDEADGFGWPVKPGQGESRLVKPSQAVFRKKRLFISCRAEASAKAGWAYGFGSAQPKSTLSCKIPNQYRPIPAKK